MDPTPEELAALDAEAIARARAMPPEEKLLAGARLFDLMARVMSAGIRAEHPDASDAEVLDILRARLRLARELENGDDR